MLSSFEKSKVVLLPVPYGKTVSYRKGTEKGPGAILSALDNLELFDDELNKETHNIGITALDPLKVGELKPKAMIDVVEKKVSELFTQNKFPVVIGGEHTVTIGAVKAAKKKYKDLSILYFDAHADLRDSYEGNKYSHACVARRLTEIAPIVEMGVRSLSKEEHDYLGNLVGCQNSNLRGCRGLSNDVYISIDLDVFDPSIMPSVGTPEPGGMLWHEFLKNIRSIIKDKNIVGLDVVELSPIKDMVAPDFTAAKLIYKIIGYIFPEK
ncbi:MAG: agmatinase [Candidatus Omnitrophica bacterium]|nr:agmatinase [Candidatus Omnitrophota bacterium]